MLWKRSSHQESNGKESLRESVFSGRHMDNVQEESHVVSVMTHKYKETCTVVRDEKDDRLLPHQIRRPRLTKGAKIAKNIRQQRGKLFRQKERNSVRLQKKQNPSCECWRPPVCQNYKSEDPMQIWRNMFLQTC